MFENIIGNNENKKILSKSILTNSVSHSYIFSGISGIGSYLPKNLQKQFFVLGNQNHVIYVSHVKVLKMETTQTLLL